jgi:hypothetical protein
VGIQSESMRLIAHSDFDYTCKPSIFILKYLAVLHDYFIFNFSLLPLHARPLSLLPMCPPPCSSFLFISSTFRYRLYYLLSSLHILSSLVTFHLIIHLLFHSSRPLSPTSFHLLSYHPLSLHPYTTTLLYHHSVCRIP